MFRNNIITSQQKICFNQLLINIKGNALSHLHKAYLIERTAIFEVIISIYVVLF